MSGALINLVRTDTMANLLDNDYSAGSELHRRYDEVRLEDPNGDPSAIPAPVGRASRDVQYNYMTGDRGRNALLTERQVTLNIDYISSDVAYKLEEWADSRAKVLVAPGFGRHTDFAYRPLVMLNGNYADGSTAYDLTGNHAIEEQTAYAGMRLWDEQRRMLGEASTTTKLHWLPTPGGAGFGYPRDTRNLWEPAYPKGATYGGGSSATASGWSKGGTDSADIAYTHVPGGFGCPDCPDSLRVDVAANVTSSRYLIQYQIWDPGHALYSGYTWTGAGTAQVTVWLKGRFPDGATLNLYGGTGGLRLSQVDLTALDLRDWTPVQISAYEVDWSLSIPKVEIKLNDSEGAPYSFEIGPFFAGQRSGTHQSLGAYWCDFAPGANGANCYGTVSNYAMPLTGTIHASFYCPPDWYDYEGYQHCDLLGTNTFALGLGKTTAGSTFMQVSQSSGGTVFEATGRPVVPGAVNTLTLSWGNAGEKIYFNGGLVATYNRAVTQWTQSTTMAASVLRMGSGYATRGCHPARLLTSRIDAYQWSDAEVMNQHLALTDPIALQLARICRGREFEIVSVPTTVRHSAGGSQIVGALKLQQVRYRNNLADPLNREESRR